MAFRGGSNLLRRGTGVILAQGLAVIFRLHVGARPLGRRTGAEAAVALALAQLPDAFTGVASFRNKVHLLSE